VDDVVFHHLEVTRPGKISHEQVHGDTRVPLDLLRERLEAVTAPGYKNQIVAIAAQAMGEGGANTGRCAGNESPSCRGRHTFSVHATLSFLTRLLSLLFAIVRRDNPDWVRQTASRRTDS
jgi:hypothetical protein